MTVRPNGRQKLGQVLDMVPWKVAVLVIVPFLVTAGLLVVYGWGVEIRTGFSEKTLWDWMELLIIPTVLAIGALLFNQSERKAEREIATDRQREAALQAYLDRMTDLMLEEGLRPSEGKPSAEVGAVHDVARARTLIVLRGLDGARKGMLLRFLHESDLIIKSEDKDAAVDMGGADLRGAKLQGANLRSANLGGRGPILRGADLSGANLEYADLFFADLSWADLRGADLRGALLKEANLHWAILKGADLSGANLSGANLSPANLSGTILRGANLFAALLGGADLGGADLRGTMLCGAKLRVADLRGADLRGADLRGTLLSGANLRGAKLQGANLRGAKVTTEQLAKVRSLEGAIMPDGTKHD